MARACVISNKSSISSKLFPLVSGIKKWQTAVVNSVADPKKKYGPLGEARRKSGAVSATVKFTSQLLS
jgi:hypothetical protein